MNPGALGKYELDVTAHDVIDVVRSAGGWLFDRSMAGWDVVVALTRECDVRPLQILGVNTRDREPDDDPSVLPRAVAIAASADVLAAEPFVRENLLRVLKRGSGDVTYWGEWPHDLARGVRPVEHVLSAAARAFKAQALTALGLSEPVAPTELFRGRTTFLGGYSDLTPSVATSVATSLAQR